jgi:protein involved in polysaccharide export with SLBB domain
MAQMFLGHRTIQRLAMLALPCCICILLLAGCDTVSSPQPASAATEERAGGRSGADGYTIQPGDLLLISVSGEPDFNQQVRVDWNGRINLPYLTGRGRSEIQAAGLSSSGLAERISDFARHGSVLLNPRVQVLVTEYSNQMFVVLGQVNQPGRYAFPRGVPPRMDLEDAIGTAGGYTRLARQSLILVKRDPNIYKVDLRKLTMHPGEPRFIVLPGDVITVTERLF